MTIDGNNDANEESLSDSKRLDGRSNVASETIGRAALADYDMSVVAESGKKVDRFLNQETPSPEKNGTSDKSSLNRGLKGGEYYLQQHGALMGLRDRSVETSKPGYLGKQIIAGGQDMIISEKDCGTRTGKKLPLHKDGKLNTKNLKGRHLASNGKQVTGAMLSSYDRQGKEELEVRSPLTCEAEEGVCAACYGLTENGEEPDIGENVGVREGQGIIEASTKLTLENRHKYLDRRMMVVVRQNGKVRIPTLEGLWQEQSTPIRKRPDGHEEREFDVETEIHDNGSWTRGEKILRHPHHEDTEMVIMRSKDGHFLIGQENHPSMLSESQSKCPECDRTLRFTNSGKTRYCRNGHVSGISVEDKPDAEEVTPDEVEDRSHLMHTEDVLKGAESVPPIDDGWLAGMFAAEGCVRHVKEKYHRKDGKTTINENPRSVMWTQYEGKVRDRLESAVRNEHAAEFGEAHANGANGKALTIDSTRLAKRYEQFGRGAENKRLPPGFIGYPNSWLRDFLAGLFDGDGTMKVESRGQSLALDTTSPVLIQQTLMICRIFEIWAQFSLTSNRELTRNQGYLLRLENAPELHQITSRTVRFSGFELKDEATSRPNEPDLIDYTRSIYTEGKSTVYGIKTTSGTLSINGVWSRNMK
ncbi:LAGLIDADG family homing endonuclease [Salinibacter ruber]|uniref:LAGLIDADG family homing endonuclease n=1 Tax=Salinibacter ruber TaxID=146919 RepID=UPI00216934DF|nr:LAGLIDADG family homing endonuclease [Salinibacter ruber]MCS4056135.1 hypothetical protein [Salinibacter ruber]MCS4059956.1 hypothetical protein [Salinibacter ruber]MCS4161551.1 hypothetical protein [Salinibacter ruber]